MISGDKTGFAIELNIDVIVSERWIYGTYFFWFGGVRLGNPKDSVDLRGCINWLISFIDREPQPVSRYFDMDKRRAFILLCASLYEFAIPNDLTKGESLLLDERRLKDPYGFEAYAYNFAEHGMSSFDNIYILAIEDTRHHRFIWQEKGGKIEEFTVEKDSFNDVARGIIRFFEEATSNFDRESE